MLHCCNFLTDDDMKGGGVIDGVTKCVKHSSHSLTSFSILLNVHLKLANQSDSEKEQTQSQFLTL